MTEAYFFRKNREIPVLHQRMQGFSLSVLELGQVCRYHIRVKRVTLIV